MELKAINRNSWSFLLRKTGSPGKNETYKGCLSIQVVVSFAFNSFAATQINSKKLTTWLNNFCYSVQGVFLLIEFLRKTFLQCVCFIGLDFSESILTTDKGSVEKVRSAENSRSLKKKYLKKDHFLIWTLWKLRSMSLKDTMTR